MKIRVIAIIVDALGTVSKVLGEQEINGRIKTILITTLEDHLEYLEEFDRPLTALLSC